MNAFEWLITMIRSYFQFLFSKEIIFRAAIVSCCAGTILVVINQWHALTNSGSDFDVPKLILTYCVPYLVSSISSATTMIFNAKSAINPDEIKRIDPEIDYDRSLNNNASMVVSGDTLIIAPNSAFSAEGGDRSTNLELALDLGLEIKNNASKVNASSIERTEFIHKLILKAEGTSESIEGLVGEMHESEADLKNMDQAISTMSSAFSNIRQELSEGRDNCTALSDQVLDFNNSFKEINAISENIKALAKQTNLLALNATIESARAGEAGKGFVVVANEVKNLATDVTGSVEQVNEVVGLLNSRLSHLTDGIQDLHVTITNAVDKAEEDELESQKTCELASILCQHSNKQRSLLSGELSEFSAIIDDIKEIKNNTESAIVGSAKNIELISQMTNEINYTNEKLYS